ncbi:hypothetical protein LU640_28940, partial [Pseudomonas monteilii]|uniref:hypothetical protein n=1 Tax=Pseudomonas monteilii TaxID=76759 RepID=UPI001E6518DB
ADDSWHLLFGPHYEAWRCLRNQGRFSQYGGTVSFTFDEEPSADEKTHFNQIALCLFQQKAHSLFACMDSVSYATRSFA